MPTTTEHHNDEPTTPHAPAQPHDPAHRERDGAGTAVVFIHGFMGSPRQFEDLSDAAFEAGCSCHSILLPGHGHGATTKEFVRFNDGDWLHHARQEVAKIRNGYGRIILVGHSVGGLLALNISLEPENHVSDVVLISTPLKILVFTPKSIVCKLRLAAYPKDNDIKAAYIRGRGVDNGNALYYPLLVGSAASVYRLIGATKKRLADVTARVCMFHSVKDETAAYESMGMLSDGLCNAQTSAHRLEKSWHAYYDPTERGMIKEKLVEIIR
jgi:carboxylesterase